MKTSDFYYDLPQELIAQDPLEDRSSSRLMHLSLKDGSIEHRHFTDVLDYMEEGDCLVINDTKVIPARLYGHKEETGALIVYTSADSVCQIAAHEEIIPVEQLYEYCKIAREMLTGDLGVGRVIARPFIGTWPNYERTIRRHDFSLAPPRQTVLDALKAEGKDVIGVGKIYDIFEGQGVTETYPNQGNEKNMEKTIEIQKKEFDGLCYVNLVDGDMIYGHRRDIAGYAGALTRFDEQLGEFLANMRDDDMLMITADHGCDPGYTGTDHTREYVPCLIYGKEIKAGVNLHTRKGFADMAATIAEALGSKYRGDGESFWDEIRN